MCHEYFLEPFLALRQPSRKRDYEESKPLRRRKIFAACIHDIAHIVGVASVRATPHIGRWRSASGRLASVRDEAILVENLAEVTAIPAEHLIA